MKFPLIFINFPLSSLKSPIKLKKASHPNFSSTSLQFDSIYTHSTSPYPSKSTKNEKFSILSNFYLKKSLMKGARSEMTYNSSHSCRSSQSQTQKRVRKGTKSVANGGGEKKEKKSLLLQFEQKMRCEKREVSFVEMSQGAIGKFLIIF